MILSSADRSARQNATPKNRHRSEPKCSAWFWVLQVSNPFCLLTRYTRREDETSIPRLLNRENCFFFLIGAGKTSILRRYFLKTFEEHSRVATLGADFYIGPVSLPNPSNSDEPEDEIIVNVQMWDTPGRERFYLNKRKRRYTASLSDSFFRQADAVMLVYDMTSSTSFTQLLR